MQINMQVCCACDRTHKGGHHLTFHAKPQGTRPHGLVTQSYGDSFAEQKQSTPPQIQSHICPEIKLEDNKGITEWERHTKRGTRIYGGSQLSVTSFLMIGTADGER